VILLSVSRLLHNLLWIGGHIIFFSTCSLSTRWIIYTASDCWSSIWTPANIYCTSCYSLCVWNSIVLLYWSPHELLARDRLIGIVMFHSLAELSWDLTSLYAKSTHNYSGFNLGLILWILLDVLHIVIITLSYTIVCRIILSIWVRIRKSTIVTTFFNWRELHLEQVENK
jgi:hypothetical protein